MSSDGDLLLAFDTSGPVGGAALGQGGEVLVSRRLDQDRRHAGALVPTLETLLAAVDRTPHDLTGIVVGAGPGSFTGVRIAAATARGLGHALGIPLYPISSLAAAAWGTGRSDAPATRFVLFDARGERLYAAAYTVRETGPPVELRAPCATTLGDVLTRWKPADPAVVCGSGAERHRERLVGAGWRVAEDGSLGVPHAAALLALQRLGWGDGPLDGRSWVPHYLKPASAIPSP